MSKWTEVKGGELHGAYNRLMVAFGDQADHIVEQINNDPAVAPRIAALCLNNGYELSASQENARKIMGTNMFGIEDAIKYYGVTPTRRQLAYMTEVPFSEATLLACKNTHILVAVFRLNLVQIRTRATSVLSKDGKAAMEAQDWYDNHPVGNDQGYAEWHLVRKTEVNNSTRKLWAEQLPLLDATSEVVPTAQVLVYTIVGHYLATAERLFEKVWVRTSTLDSDGRRVHVRFTTDGVGVSSGWDGNRNGPLGVSSSRKQES